MLWGTLNEVGQGREALPTPTQSIWDPAVRMESGYAKEKRLKDARALMNLHNNRCGRTVSTHVCACTFVFAGGGQYL